MKEAKAAHVWDRDSLDWYVEPIDCTTALLRAERFRGAIWDPACGAGNIIRAVLAERECFVFGSDIVNRGWPEKCTQWTGEQDFLTTDPLSFPAQNIIMNPPFGRGLKAEAFIRHALAHPTLAKLAVFLDLKFLGSYGRATGLFAEFAPSRVWMIAPRPSCPPGEYLKAGNKAGGGTADWVWVVWDRTAPPMPTTFRWLIRPPVLHTGASPAAASVAA